MPKSWGTGRATQQESDGPESSPRAGPLVRMPIARGDGETGRDFLLAPEQPVLVAQEKKKVDVGRSKRR